MGTETTRRWRRFKRAAAFVLAFTAGVVNLVAAVVLFAHGNPLGVLNLTFAAGSPILYRVMTYG